MRCKNGYGNLARGLVAPNSGVVSKIRGKTVIAIVPGNGGWPRGGPRNRGIGAPTRATPGPSERPRGDADPGELPSASRARPHYAPSQPNSQMAASISLPHNFDSVLALGSKLRLSLSLSLSLTHTHTHTLPPPRHFFSCFFLLERSHAMMDNSTLHCRTTGSGRMHAIMAPGPWRPRGAKADSVRGRHSLFFT